MIMMTQIRCLVLLNLTNPKERMTKIEERMTKIEERMTKIEERMTKTRMGMKTKMMRTRMMIHLSNIDYLSPDHRDYLYH
jgi:predicted AlkP superfamily phosphohydrolase/phosphomutase